MYNSISSSCVPVSVPVQLLEDKPGQVENLQVTASNVSVTVMWGPPGVTNGNVNGYTVSLGESVVSSVFSKESSLFTCCSCIHVGDQLCRLKQFLYVAYH